MQEPCSHEDSRRSGRTLERLRVICEIPADLNNGGKERSDEWPKVRNRK